MKHRIKAQVDMSALRNNYNYIQNYVGKDVRVMAVVKADAYGHGAQKVGRQLQRLGCRDFAVACLSEAYELRKGGIKGNILILGPTDKTFAKDIIENDIIQAVDSYDYAKSLSEHGRIKVHIKVDTGMSRIGFYCHSDDDIKNCADGIEKVSKLPNVSIEGIFTHFADSDGENRDFTDKQFSVFSKLLKELRHRSVHVGTKHCCNSAATIRYKEMHLDMVRAGIILYGLMPSENTDPTGFTPVMKLMARVCAVHPLKKGDCVSYGCTYRAEKDTNIAVVSIGYADGFSRACSGKKLVRINGKDFATVGKICMDMCMVDIGNDFPCRVGDEAVIFENAADIDRLAEALNTIN